MLIRVGVDYNEYETKSYRGIFLVIESEFGKETKIFNDHDKEPLSDSIINRWSLDWVDVHYFIENNLSHKDLIVFDKTFIEFSADSQIPSPLYYKPLENYITKLDNSELLV